MPRPVGIAADDAHDPQQLGPLRAGGAVGEGSELVRHGDEDPVHVPRSREARHNGVEVIGRHLHRHAYAVVAALPECACKALRDSTYVMGSPMIGNSRVAPSRWSAMSSRLPFVSSEVSASIKHVKHGVVPVQQIGAFQPSSAPGGPTLLGLGRRVRGRII